MSYQHILYPTDGSEEAQKALVHVKKIALAFDAKVSVMCVYKLPYSMVNNFVSLPKEIYEQYKQDNKTHAKKIVEQLASELINMGIDSESFVAEGNPKLLICDYAKKLNCDLIIMGTRGNSQLNYAGSTSTHVINNVKNCPVMVVD